MSRIEPRLPYPLSQLRYSEVCPECGVLSQFTLLVASSPTPLGEIGAVHQCQSCYRLYFIKWQHTGTQAPNGVIVNNPEPVQIVIPVADLSYVAEDVKKDFNEARKCYGANCFNAFASMCRRSIQSIFADKGFDGKSKVEKQFTQFRDEYKDEDANSVLDELIKAGHDGAHPHLPEVTEGRANLMFKLMTDLLDQLYNRPGRIADSAEKRRQQIEKEKQA